MAEKLAYPVTNILKLLKVNSNILALLYLKLLEVKNRKTDQYELTSPIFYLEECIPISLIVCEPFSRILEIL